MKQIQVFIDGICYLCAKEAHWLVRNDVHQRLELIDISDSKFNAAEFGLNAKNVQTFIHAIDENGKTLTGVSAFIVVYRQLPKYRWLSRILAFPLLRPVFEIGYRTFVLIRKVLPKRKTSVFCELKPR